ncbi:MAG: hypothetical protein IKX68_02765 [Clostridiales bacterium]|nr:hypothetical protein [Clostridiales bacterium]
MKKSKVILVGSAVFIAALNLTACHYGPPQDYNESTAQKTEVQQLEEATEDSVESEKP